MTKIKYIWSFAHSRKYDFKFCALTVIFSFRRFAFFFILTFLSFFLGRFLYLIMKNTRLFAWVNDNIMWHVECLDNSFRLCLTSKKYEIHDIIRFPHQTQTEHDHVTSQNWSDTSGTPKWIERSEKIFQKIIWKLVNDH